VSHVRKTLYLVDETDLARKFTTDKSHGAAPEFWVPRTHVKSITKFKPMPGEWQMCLVDIAEWKARELGLV
jgi:hypothetical protein